MYNRYYGNTGRRERVPEPVSPGPGAAPVAEAREAEGGPPGPEPREEARRPPPPPPPEHWLNALLGRLSPGALETEDLLVLAVLWLLYRERGDRELLLMLGAYLFF